MKPIYKTKREARRILRPVYWQALLLCLGAYAVYGYLPPIDGVPFTVYNALQMIVFPDSPIFRLLILMIPLHIFIVGPLSVGKARYFLRGVDGEWKLRHLFSPFLSLDYFRIVFVMGLRLFWIILAVSIGIVIFFLSSGSARWFFFVAIFLYTGLYLFYRQRLTAYILADNPKLKFKETWYENYDLLPGRMAIFSNVLFIDISFAGWYIVGGLSFFGVGQFFFMPYHEMTLATRFRELSPLPDTSDETEPEDNGEHFDTPSPSFGLKSSATVLLVAVLSVALLAGLLPITATAVDAESEFIVTTEQELRYAVEQNLSPIRIDTTIELIEGEIMLEDGQDIVLRGTGTIIVANVTQPWSRSMASTRHFNIRDGRLTLQDEVRLTSTPYLEYVGGVLLDSNWNTHSHFIMEGGRIEYNNSVYGGGVYVRRGYFQMHGGVIHGNTARMGGGVHLGSISSVAEGFSLMTGGIISGNIATDSGGGVHASTSGHFVMRGGQITRNSARRFGGGVSIWWFPSSFSMESGEISYNHVDGLGGAIGLVLGSYIKHTDYERINIGHEALFRGNTADGEMQRRSPGHFGFHAGLEEFPHIRWSGNNSRPGMHLINNYDIAFHGRPRPSGWQVQLSVLGGILIMKGIAFVIFFKDEKKAKLQEGGALCNER
jgi:hypothetical protein